MMQLLFSRTVVWGIKITREFTLCNIDLRLPYAALGPRVGWVAHGAADVGDGVGHAAATAGFELMRDREEHPPLADLICGVTMLCWGPGCTSRTSLLLLLLLHLECFWTRCRGTGQKRITFSHVDLRRHHAALGPWVGGVAHGAADVVDGVGHAAAEAVVRAAVAPLQLMPAVPVLRSSGEWRSVSMPGEGASLAPLSKGSPATCRCLGPLQLVLAVPVLQRSSHAC